MIARKSEFFGSRGLVAELWHKDEGMQVEACYFFPEKKNIHHSSGNNLNEEAKSFIL